ncbi:hypothetical protein BDN72DRAFT_855486 [Pluteus cervinus]|uniref:Uncharacterized protein n=1 Tax=Pluteus cervinus TaxID=181527 RepID=A0ACD3B3M7_9AGAR|nr:hypothetical protein BDN72DRAFT_855486 [Pluteus cervinus]
MSASIKAIHRTHLWVLPTALQHEPELSERIIRRAARSPGLNGSSLCLSSRYAASTALAHLPSVCSYGEEFRLFSDNDNASFHTKSRNGRQVRAQEAPGIVIVLNCHAGYPLGGRWRPDTSRLTNHHGFQPFVPTLKDVYSGPSEFEFWKLVPPRPVLVTGPQTSGSWPPVLQGVCLVAPIPVIISKGQSYCTHEASLGVNEED